jgi:hypothetical protein
MLTSLLTLLLAIITHSAASAQPGETSILPHQAIATQCFGNDAPWFEENIPFFECSDPEITQVYYYRWQLYGIIGLTKGRNVCYGMLDG